MDQQHADDLRGVGGKGIVRMSTKQVTRWLLIMVI
jgi:kinesin family protein 15